MIRKRSPIPTSPHLLVEAASTPSLTSAATTMFTVGDGKGGCPDRQGWLRAGCLVGKPLEKASSLYSSGGRVVGKPATEDVPAKLLASAGVEEPYRVTQRNSAWAGRVLLQPWPAEPDRHLVLKQRPDWSVVIAQVGRGVDDQGNTSSGGADPVRACSARRPKRRSACSAVTRGSGPAGGATSRKRSSG